MIELPVEKLMALELVKLLILNKGKHGLATFRLSPLLEKVTFFL